MVKSAAIETRLRRLSRLAWQVRAASRRPCSLPFALVFMTDSRRHGPLLPVLDAFPRARKGLPPIAVIFRHTHLAEGERLALARTAAARCRSKGHVFLVRGADLGSVGDGSHHGPTRIGSGRYASDGAHHLGEIMTASTRGRSPILLSPVFATKSHREAQGMGLMRAASMAETTAQPVFALGGVDQQSAKRLVGLPFSGLATIGGIVGDPDATASKNALA